MSVIVPIVSEITILDDFLHIVDLKLHLYKSNTTPISTTVLTDLTEADFVGYAAQTIVKTNWTTPTNDGAGRAISNNLLFNFAATSGATPNDIYGYYVTNTGSTIIYWCERFTGAPIPMSTTGATLSIVPVLTMKSEF